MGRMDGNQLITQKCGILALPRTTCERQIPESHVDLFYGSLSSSERVMGVVCGQGKGRFRRIGDKRKSPVSRGHLGHLRKWRGPGGKDGARTEGCAGTEPGRALLGEFRTPVRGRGRGPRKTGQARQTKSVHTRSQEK